MSVYKVTFHGGEDLVYRTVLSGSSFEDAQNKLHLKMKNRELFEVLGKGNHYVEIQLNNIAFIEYEFLGPDSNDFIKIIEKMMCTEEVNQLIEVFNKSKNLLLLSVILGSLPDKLKEEILELINEPRRKVLVEDIKNLGTLNIGEAETFEAQKTFLKLLNE